MVTPEGRYRAGLVLGIPSANRSYHHESSEPDDAPPEDYYDVLQLSPKAEPEMIHRAYRLLAQRLHPDNKESGNAQSFRILLEAYKALSDPEKRAAYDIERHVAVRKRWKIFTEPLNGGMEDERRKRTGILKLLYTKRLRVADQPTLTIHELEDLMGCPREHLEASLWFLQGKGWCTRSDNGRYSITVPGFEQAESQDPPNRPAEHLFLPPPKP